MLANLYTKSEVVDMEKSKLRRAVHGRSWSSDTGYGGNLQPSAGAAPGAQAAQPTQAQTSPSATPGAQAAQPTQAQTSAGATPSATPSGPPEQSFIENLVRTLSRSSQPRDALVTSISVRF